VSAQFSLEIPLGNNAAEGRFAQAQATERQSRIQAADLRRVIRNNVLNAAESLRKAALVVEQRRAAVERSTEAHTGANEQLKVGEITVIDVLTLEESLTRDHVSLVQALLVYHSTMARLRYETGDLVSWDGEGTEGERVTFATNLFTLPVVR
jgi:outer membrane protein TolC